MCVCVYGPPELAGNPARVRAAMERTKAAWFASPAGSHRAWLYMGRYFNLREQYRRILNASR